MRAALLIVVLGCGGGGSDSKPDAKSPDAPDVAKRKRVFITKAAFTGTLMMVGGADQKCASAASAANLGGQWLAWIGDSHVDAGANIVDKGGWTNVTGGAEIFAAKPNIAAAPQNWTKLQYEDGSMVTGGIVNAWTGPGTDAMPCNDWTTDFWPKCSAVGIVGGGEDGSGNTWQSGMCVLCTNTAHLYCFEQ
jgi:hypothetical protein